MADLQEYKCPSCGGALAFDSNLQKMKCPFCDSTYEMSDLEALDEGLKANKPDDMKWDTDVSGKTLGSENIRSYSCRSCGGEIIGDANTAAISCPFCGNPVVIKDNFTGMLRPELIIPFKLDKKAAKEALKKHISGKLLLPKIFKDQNHIDEIKGVYIPFWLFSAEANVSIRYEGTKDTTWSDSRFNYTKTDYYYVYREGSLGFDNIPVDGSAKMPEELTESLEPYNMEDAVDFQTAYLAGYIADKYDIQASDCVNHANERAKASSAAEFLATAPGYSMLTVESSSISLDDSNVKYALLPVWILNTTWNNNKYTFAMNAQTGKFIGDLPLDKGAYLRWLLGLSAAFTAVLFAICSMLLML